MTTYTDTRSATGSTLVASKNGHTQRLEITWRIDDKAPTRVIARPPSAWSRDLMLLGVCDDALTPDELVAVWKRREGWKEA